MGTTAGPAGWLRRRDPGLRAVRRAVRVTLAGCVGFYVSRYALDDAQMAVFAVFGCISLGALSEITGTPQERTRTLVLAWLVGLGLVTLGTLLAVSTWAAVAGMLVVGFVVAYAGVGGPRVVGIVNGLQLLYILPSFPPYVPEKLDSRLLGLTVGVGLLVLADRFVLPADVPEPFRRRLGTAAATLHGRLVEVLHGGAPVDPASGDGAPTGVLAPLRLSGLPPLERPTGPGRRDRAATHIGRLLRGLDRRTASLGELAPVLGARLQMGAGHALLDEATATLDACARALTGPGGEPPDPRRLDRALADYLVVRRERVGVLLQEDDVAARLRFAVLAEEVALWVRELAVATRVILGVEVPLPVVTGTGAGTADPLWYVRASPGELWWRRLRGHLTTRSTYLQNAVRLALGLSLARVVAGELDLSHGFWVLLATLTLMRTSAISTRAAIGPAFLGTALGAVGAALVLGIVADERVVFQVGLPLVMVTALAAAQVWGVVLAQALFTMLVALLFAQLAPATWELAGVRLLDVVLGGLLGAVVGLLVWPRGAQAELVRTTQDTLRAAADDVQASVRRLLRGAVTGASREAVTVDRAAVHRLMLADSTYAQVRSEPAAHAGGRDDVDWLSVLALAHEAVWGGEVLRLAHPHEEAVPWPQVVTDLEALGGETAEDLRAVASSLDGAGAGAALPPVRREPPAAGELPASGNPDDALRAVDVWGWLVGLQGDADRSQPAARSGSPAASA